MDVVGSTIDFDFNPRAGVAVSYTADGRAGGVRARGGR